MSDSYYSEPRSEIRALIPATGARILDIGCGEGVLGASLKAGGATHVAGVELHGSSANAARERLDVIVEGSIVNVELPFAADEFDFLVFADVLEHLPDPDYALQRCLPFLRTGGQVIISVPNWRFYAVLLRLIFDRWEYADSGVRDRTHLRVFTRYSLEQFIARNGLELQQLNRNLRLLENQSQIGRVGALATRMANATLGRWPASELMAYQYVAIASKTA